MADLPTKVLPEGTKIEFTFYWPDASRWEAKDFIVHVGPFDWDGTASAEWSETYEK